MVKTLEELKNDYFIAEEDIARVKKALANAKQYKVDVHAAWVTATNNFIKDETELVTRDNKIIVFVKFKTIKTYRVLDVYLIGKQILKDGTHGKEKPFNKYDFASEIAWDVK